MAQLVEDANLVQLSMVSKEKPSIKRNLTSDNYTKRIRIKIKECMDQIIIKNYSYSKLTRIMFSHKKVTTLMVYKPLII